MGKYIKIILAILFSISPIGLMASTTWLSEDLSAYFDEPYFLIPDGPDLFVAGVQATNYSSYIVRVEKRVQATGSLDLAFNGSGVLAISPTSGSWQLADAKILNGNLYIVSVNSLSGTVAVQIEKRDPVTGALIGAFGTGGIVTYGGLSISTNVRVDVSTGG